MFSGTSLARLYREPGSTPPSVVPATPWLAVVTCMDPRVLPTRAVGVAPGDAYILRNAGGRATDDVVRSLLFASAARGVREFVVMHHEDCGLVHHSDPELQELVRERLGGDVTPTEFGTFTDHEAALAADVEAVRDAGCVPPGGALSGLIVDEGTGRVRVVIADPASQLAWGLEGRRREARRQSPSP